MSIKSIALAATALFLSTSVNAALIEITATSNDARFSDFTVIFDDTSGDSMLQINEMTLFSGMTISGFSSSQDGFYDALIGTPNITGISTLSGTVIGSPGFNWNMTTSSGASCCSTSIWSYNSSVATVPIPTAVWLFGSGFIGLIGVARRKKA